MFEHLNTPEELFSFKLGSALKMEQELVDVLEEFEARAQRPEIKRALSEHREETLQHAKATIKKTDDSLVDVVILAAASESEHYELAVYDTLITNADARGATEVVALLQRNRNEEKQALQLARATMKTLTQEGMAVAVSD